MPRSKHPAILTAAVLLLAGLAAQASTATRTAPPLASTTPTATPLPYTVTAWGAKEGAPSSVRALAQTPDGFLWLGTGTGLYRFDGVRFERFAPPLFPALPSNAVRGVLATRDGGLWIAAARHVLLLEGGRIVRTDEVAESLGNVTTIAGDGQGQMVAVATRAVLELDGARWQSVAPDLGAGLQHWRSAFYAADGSLWIAGSAGVLHRPHNGAPFARLTQLASFGAFGQTSDGSVWFHDFQFGLKRFHPDGDIDSWSLQKGGTILVDQGDVGLLGTEYGVAIEQLPPRLPAEVPGGEPRPFSGTLPAGLAEIESLALLKDHEGNIWIATYDGLLRMRPNRLLEPALPGGSGGIAAGPGGGIVLVSHTRGMIEVGARVQPVPEAGVRLTYVHRDRNGVLWIGGKDRNELLRFESGAMRTLPMPPDITDGFVDSIAVDRSGAPWIAINPSPGGTYRWNGSDWQARGGVEGLPAMPAMSLAAGDDGRLWLGYAENRLFVVDGTRATGYGAREGLDVGRVQWIAPHRADVYVGGEEGVDHLVDGRFRKLRPARDAFLGISSLLVSRDGDLWVTQANGILRVPKAELVRAHGDARHLVEVERFDYRDGLEGSPTQVAPTPTSAEADDGTLWFTAKNLVRIDPRAIPRNTVVPSVHVVSVTMSDGLRPAAADMRLPLGTRDFTIAYTAPSLTDPDKVLRFRYKLAGHDRNWRDGGALREASYSNLPTGQYEFRVIASNNDGLWNDAGARMRLDLPPMFHETHWFKALCAAVVIGLLLLAFWIRSRQVTARVRDRLRERYAERERIARELHDTLLQGVQGLILHFQVIADRLPRDDPQRAPMDTALDSADTLMKQGRERVSDLRASGSGQELAAYFRSVGAVLSAGHDTRLQVAETGRPRALQPATGAELKSIVGEALINAFRHAQASRVDLQINYGERALQLDIRDDGRGIDAAVLATGGRPGHWGLAGMKERALKLGGVLEIDSAAQRGTHLTVTVPATLAYPAVRMSLLARCKGALGLQ